MIHRLHCSGHSIERRNIVGQVLGRIYSQKVQIIIFIGRDFSKNAIIICFWESAYKRLGFRENYGTHTGCFDFT